MATGIQLAPPPRRRDPMADALMAQATDSSPKGHWLAAVAQALQGYVGAKMHKQSQQEQTEQERRIAEALRGQFAGGGPSQTGDTRVAPMAPPASLSTPPGAPLQPQQSPAMSVNDPIAAALMGQPAGQASFNAPPAPPDTRPQAPPLAAAMREAGNPMGEAQALAMALMGQGQQPDLPTSVQEYEFARRQGFQGTYQDWEDRNRPESPSRLRDDKIRDLMRQGVPEQRAVRLVDGRERIELVPQLGLARYINEVDNSVQEVPIGTLTAAEASSGEVVPPDADQFKQSLGMSGDQTLYQLADLATGPGSALAAATAAPRAWVGLPRSERVTEARQTFNLAQRELMRGLVNNPRFPVAEMNAVLSEIGIDPRIWDDGDVMRDRMHGLDGMLRTRMDLAEKDAKDPTLPQDLRAAQAQNARLIKNFLPVLGVPQRQPQQTDGPPAPEGWEAEWPTLSPEEKARVIELTGGAR